MRLIEWLFYNPTDSFILNIHRHDAWQLSNSISCSREWIGLTIMLIFVFYFKIITLLTNLFFFSFGILLFLLSFLSLVITNNTGDKNLNHSFVSATESPSVHWTLNFIETNFSLKHGLAFSRNVLQTKMKNKKLQ